MTELGEIRVELRSHDARLTANHDSIGVLRERTAEHHTKLQVLMTELREGREDIGEMRSQLAGVSRSFYMAAAAMAGLMLSVVGLIATILVHP